jgi:hypothetical protein
LFDRFEWARFQYANDIDVFTVSAYGDVGHSKYAKQLPHSENFTAVIKRGGERRKRRKKNNVLNNPNIHILL